MCSCNHSVVPKTIPWHLSPSTNNTVISRDTEQDLVQAPTAYWHDRPYHAATYFNFVIGLAEYRRTVDGASDPYSYFIAPTPNPL